MTRKQKGLAIAAVVVAASAAILFFVNPGWLTDQSGETDMAGTISRAERYQAGGMTAKDVVLTKADVTKMLQDPGFQNLVKSAGFQRLIQDPNFVELMKEDRGGASRLLGDPRLRDAFGAMTKIASIPGGEEGTSAFELLVKNEDFVALLRQADLAGIVEAGKASGLFQNAAFYELLRDKKLADLLAAPEIKALIKNPVFARFVVNDSKYAPVKQRLETADAWDLVMEAQRSENLDKISSNPALADLARDAGFEEFFKDPDIATLHMDREFLNIVERDHFSRLVQTLNVANVYLLDGGGAFSKMVNNPGFTELLTKLELLSETDRGAVLEVIGDANFRVCLGNPDFLRACSRPDFPEIVKALADAAKEAEGLDRQAGRETKTRMDGPPEMVPLLNDTRFFFLLQNPAFARIVGTGAFKALMDGGPGLRDLIKNLPCCGVGPSSLPISRVVVLSPQYALFKDAGFRALLADSNFQSLMADANFQKLAGDMKSLSDLVRYWGLEEEEEGGVIPPSLKANPAFNAVLSNPQYKAVLSSPAAFYLFGDANIVPMAKEIECDGCDWLFADDRLARIYASLPGVVNIVLANPAFGEMAGLIKGLGSECEGCVEQFVGLIQNPKMIFMFKDYSLFNLMQEPTFAGLVSNGTLQIVLSNPNFNNMLNDSIKPLAFKNRII